MRTSQSSVFASGLNDNPGFTTATSSWVFISNPALSPARLMPSGYLKPDVHRLSDHHSTTSFHFSKCSCFLLLSCAFLPEVSACPPTCPTQEPRHPPLLGETSLSASQGHQVLLILPPKQPPPCCPPLIPPSHYLAPNFSPHLQSQPCVPLI